MKKIIYFLGILFLIIIILLNLLYTSFLDNSEHSVISYNSYGYDCGILIASICIYYIANKINKLLIQKSKTSKKKLFITLVVLYGIFNIIWVIFINPKVVGDSVHVCNLAQTMYRNDPEEFLFNSTYIGIPLYEYIEAYPHQIPIAFIFSIIFKIIHFDIMEVLRIINIISNIAIVIGLYKLHLKLSQKYKCNTSLMFILILTFFTLPLLSTYIYGDLPSLALCIFATYFIISFIETKNIKYFIYTTLLTMVAYMMRMNTLIFIIATSMYMLLNLLQNWKGITLYSKLKSINFIAIYIIVSIIPSILVINYYSKKYNLDNTKTYPTTSYILMAMEESPRGNGWYNENIAEPAVKNPDIAKKEYSKKIFNRIRYFTENPSYTFDFYTKKIASMWTENTYSAIRNNIRGDNDYIETFIKPLEFYQKALLLVNCFCCLLFLILNRKDLSLEIIFLLTIFVGGFSFHILWEAKSRYIIPYIVFLIPIASLYLKSHRFEDYK